MRLIDADALIELLQAWKCVAQERGAEINNLFASATIAQVDAMPTIEPERKTGEWIGTAYDGYADGNPVYYEWKCSKCGCIIEEEERPTYNYCPQCGADMRGEQDG